MLRTLIAGLIKGSAGARAHSTLHPALRLKPGKSFETTDQANPSNNSLRDIHKYQRIGGTSVISADFPALESGRILVETHIRSSKFALETQESKGKAQGHHFPWQLCARQTAPLHSFAPGKPGCQARQLDHSLFGLRLHSFSSPFYVLHRWHGLHFACWAWLHLLTFCQASNNNPQSQQDKLCPHESCCIKTGQPACPVLLGAKAWANGRIMQDNRGT